MHAPRNGCHGTRIGHQDAGNNMVAVNTSTNDLTDDIALATPANQVRRMQQGEGFWCAKLVDDLFDSVAVSVLIPPGILQRIAVGMNTRYTPLVDLCADWRRELPCAILMDLLPHPRILPYFAADARNQAQTNNGEHRAHKRTCRADSEVGGDQIQENSSAEEDP